MSREVWAIAADVVGYRRHAHRQPEVSWEEHDTQRRLLRTLRGFGIEDIR